MNIDIKTIIAVTIFIHLVQAVIFFYQYKVNKTYKGIGWWLLWSITEVAGFFSIFFRDIPSIQNYVIFIQNNLIILGLIFLYIGIMRFLHKRENLYLIISILGIFEIVFLYYLLIDYNMNIRGGLVSLVIFIISFITAYSLIKHKLKNIIVSANFLAIVFVIHGIVFAYRFFMLFFENPPEVIYAPVLYNLIPFVDALFVSILWSFGLIIMLNQRLNTEMAETKEHFEEIFNTSPDGVGITRMEDGKIININKAYNTLTGYTREEVINQTSTSINFWKNPKDREEIVSILRSDGVCMNYEAIFLKKDGSEFYGLMSAKIISLNGVPHIISITRDITNRKKTEQDIQKINEELESRVGQRTDELESKTKELNENQEALLNLVEDLNEANEQIKLSKEQLEISNRELEAFAYSVSHDLRAPLRHVIGFTQKLEKTINEKEYKEVNRLTGKIKDAASTMNNLIDDLLQYSRIGRTELKKQKVSVKNIVSDIVRDSSDIFPGINVEWKIKELPDIIADTTHLKLVFQNLIHNAIKFSSKKEKAIIEIGHNRNGDNYDEFYVKDNGAGFDMNYVDKLFGVFQRLHTLNEFEGTGIGLANVRRIVKRHGGKVRAEGKINEGAVFFISLPVNE